MYWGFEMGSEVNESLISDTLVCSRDLYEDVHPTEGKTSAILRTIKGPIAEWGGLNRNNRKYSEKLWDNTLESPYLKEQLRYKTLFGEANHPEGRYEVDFARVSHSITEMWKVPASNQIYATINILDTPLGRILNTLYESGSVLGYSTRAGGSLIPRKGYKEVDEKTYNFITVDAVPYPSVESARPGEVLEGAEISIESLTEEVHDKLCNIIEGCSLAERKVVKDLIYSLENYDLSKEKSLLEGNSSDIDNETSNLEEATMQLLKESSEQLDKAKLENQTLKATNESLKNENASLRKNLNSSLAKMTNMLSESKSHEMDISNLKLEQDDTIRKLNEKIESLKDDVQDRD